MYFYLKISETFAATDFPFETFVGQQHVSTASVKMGKLRCGEKFAEG